jgi:hypothetical protein
MGDGVKSALGSSSEQTLFLPSVTLQFRQPADGKGGQATFPRDNFSDTILIFCYAPFSALASANAGYVPTLVQAFQKNSRLPRLCLFSYDGVFSRSLFDITRMYSS